MTKHLIVGLIKNLSLHKMKYYPKPDSYERNKIKVELHLSNYATKSYLKGRQASIRQNLPKGLI